MRDVREHLSDVDGSIHVRTDAAAVVFPFPTGIVQANPVEKVRW